LLGGARGPRREAERALPPAADEALAARDEAWRRLPNLTHPASPRGFTDDDHRELHAVWPPRDFAEDGLFPRDPLELAEELGLVDFAAGAKVAGQKFYYLKRE